MTLLLAGTAAILFAVGTYLLLQRTLSRIIIGIGLAGHGAVTLLVAAGQRGDPPLIGQGSPLGFADPLPQALALTAIVINFGVTAVLLALAYRSWLLTRDDEVVDDLSDRTITVHSEADLRFDADLGRARIDPDVDGAVSGPAAAPAEPAADDGEG